MSDHDDGVWSGPVGVVLAGGIGRRLGGDKAAVALGERPLISYPVEALRVALGDVAVVAKADTALPRLPGVAVWIEPATPRHPVVGIRAALRFADGRPVFVCAADLPFVTPAVISRIAGADPAGAPAVVAASEGEMQPLLGLYLPVAGELLDETPAGAGQPLREIVGALRPGLVEVDDQEALFNVNTAEELARAAAMLRDRGRRWRVG